GNGFVASAGANVDYTLTDSDGAASTIDHTSSTCDTVTDNNGQCTIVFTSPATGTVTTNASATLTLQGIEVTRNTSADSGPNGSGPATKRWVDANITIGPNGNNPVGAPHTFTVTVNKDNGSGGGFVPAEGEHVDFSLTDSDGAKAVVDTASSTC